MNDRLSEIKQLQNINNGGHINYYETNPQSSLFNNCMSHNHTNRNQDQEREPLLTYDSSTTDSDSTPNSQDKEVSYLPKQESIKDFFSKVRKIKSSSRQITSNIDKLTNLRQQILHCPSPNKEKHFTKQLDILIGETNNLINKIKLSLSSIQQEIFHLSSELSGSQFNSKLKTKENIFLGLSKNFIDHVQEFRIFQSEYKKQIYDKFSKQIRLVHPEASELEISSMLKSGINHKIVALHNFTDSRSTETIIGELTSKSADIKRLERGVIELHELFVELSEYVANQDKEIEHIQITVNKSNETLDDANINLLQAKNHNDSARKRTIVIFMTLLTFAIILLSKTLTQTIFMNTHSKLI